MLTATAPWSRATATPWRLAVRARSTTSTHNARILPGGRLDASGAFADTRYPVQPSPTLATCLTAWNSRDASARRAFAGTRARPARLTAEREPGGALTVGGAVSTGGAAKTPAPALGLQACVLTFATAARRVTQVAGSWRYGRVSRWRAVASTPGTGAFAPNARLLPDGTLELG